MRRPFIGITGILLAPVLLGTALLVACGDADRQAQGSPPPAPTGQPVETAASAKPSGVPGTAMDGGTPRPGGATVTSAVSVSTAGGGSRPGSSAASSPPAPAPSTSPGLIIPPDSGTPIGGGAQGGLPAPAPGR